MKNGSEPSMPIAHQAIDANDEFFKPGAKGLTKRELIAAMAIQGVAGDAAFTGCETTIKQIAKSAVRVADALLDELSKHD